MSDSDAYDRAETGEEEYRAARANPEERGKWISALVALLGLWLVVQAFLLNPVAGNFWSDIIIGVALVGLGGYNYYRRADDRIGSVAVGAFVALLGLWMVVTPFLFGSAQANVFLADFDSALWNDVIIGLLVFILGAYSAYKARETESRAATARGA